MLFIFRDSDAVIPDGSGIAGAVLPLSDDSVPDGMGILDSFELDFPDGSAPCRVLLAEDEAVLPAGWQSVTLRSVLSAAAEAADLPPGSADRMLRAYHIAQWRRGSAYCGRCGSPNGDAPDETARLCPVCGRREYPRISPAVIVAVTDKNDRLLLAHNGKFRAGMYSLIAGFVEAGESLEETVVREVMEETGISVAEVVYAASQPWPFPDSLMIGFRAAAISDERAGAVPEPVPDGKEILDAHWFARDSLPDIPGKGSLSRLLIDRWIEGSRP